MSSAGSVAPRLAALIGNPVRHSLSPTIHNAAAHELGADLVYVACHVERSSLNDAVKGLWALGAVGANVTIPYKRAALRMASTASETARALGASNTLVRRADGWHADNTDVEGFVAPLDPFRRRLEGADAVVLGAGGAARAVVYGLRTLGVARTTVVARRPEQARTLLHDLGADGDAATFEEAGNAVDDAAIVVNATPVGMAPGETPWPTMDGIYGDQIVYDLLYRPAETELMRAARAGGATVIGGLPMLIGQAAASFRLWTGLDMPIDVAERAAHIALDL